MGIALNDGYWEWDCICTIPLIGGTGTVTYEKLAEIGIILVSPRQS